MQKILDSTFEVGDSVILNGDEDFVREQFRIFDNGQICWTEGLARPMLGKTSLNSRAHRGVGSITVML